MLVRKDYIENITYKLSWVKTYVEMTSKGNLHDISIYSENFFCGFLNLLFSYNLKNLNALEQNRSAIDLGDEDSKIAVQVTSENSRSKIEDTIEKFIKYELYNRYNRLIVLIIGNKKAYAKPFATEFISFDASKDIMDINVILQSIQNESTDKLKDISEFLDREIVMPRSDALSKANLTTILEQMQQHIRARCLSKLKTIGIENDIANHIIEADINSDKFNYILDAADGGKSYLVGGFGTGKSHSVLILAQKMIRNYLDGQLQYIPLFISANELYRKHGTIQEWVAGVAAGGNYFIFVDGLDEVEYTQAESLANEVSYLRELWVGSRLVITSRPMSFLDNDSIPVALLTKAERLALFCLVSGEKIEDGERALGHLEQRFDKTLFTPFFCIIYAIYRGEPKAWAKNDIDLITAFINKSLATLRHRNFKAYMGLERIAMVSVSLGLQHIHQTEVANTDVNELMQTGFIDVSCDEYIEFPLPIVAQWLAADAIRHGEISINKILENHQMLINWRYSLSILFGLVNFEESLRYITLIVRKNPAIASIIIKEGIRFGQLDTLPPIEECGKRLYNCMQIWADSLDQLSKYIAPIDSNGKVITLGIDVIGGDIATSWSNDGSGEADVIFLPGQDLVDWGGEMTVRGTPAQATWPWIITFEYLVDKMEKVIKRRELFLPDSVMQAEYIWDITGKLANRGSLDEREIELSSILKYNQHMQNIFIFGGEEMQLDTYFNLVDDLICRGEKTILPPYPVSDRPNTSGWVWGAFSQARMLEKVRYVYANALLEYKQLVETIFSTLKDQMPMYRLLPGKLVGTLRYDDMSAGMNGGPALEWYIVALPSGEESFVSIELQQEKQDVNFLGDKLLWDRVQKTNRKNRPEYPGEVFSAFHSGRMDIFITKPVTHLVYEWVKDDLKKIGWYE